MHPIRLAKLAVLGATASILFAGAAAVAAERGAEIARPYKPGTVRVTARFADCQPEEGFGFIVGERADGALFAVTADPVPASVAGSGQPETFRDRLDDGGEGPLMVRVPKGCFRMGDIQGGGGEDEQPVHEVCLEGFAIGVHEATFADYDRFAAATGRDKPDDEGWGRGERPVINVSWRDANAYAEWLSAQTGEQYRLPTEAEWEYAARAGRETRYWWGNEIGRNRANCDGCGSRWDNDRTAPAGSPSTRIGWCRWTCMAAPSPPRRRLCSCAHPWS